MIKIVKPKVYLIASTHIVAQGLSDFVKEQEILYPWDPEVSDAEHLIETAGRICYMSYGKGRNTTEAMVRNLVASGHHSVLEHASWTLLLTGISRSLSHEFVRHRHFSYSQLSQRYVDSSEVAFVMPDEIAGDPILKDVWEFAVDEAAKAYRHIANNLTTSFACVNMSRTQCTKMARQAARSVLPNATETKMVVTGNARAWMHFFEMRGSIHADVEIRRLAVMILETLKPEAPTIFENYTVTTEGCIDVTGASSGKDRPTTTNA